MQKYISQNTRIIDGNKQLLIPGFTDSHCHFIDGGFRLSSVKLREVTSKEEFIQVLKNYASTLSNKDDWILGGDWDHQKWEGILPDKSWVDEVENPVWLNRLDGHMSLANSRVMKIANISENTIDLEGGIIIKNEDNKPTGLFKDNAMNLIAIHIPTRTEEEYDKAVEYATNYVVKHGVTEIHNMVTVDCVDGLWPDRTKLSKDYSASINEINAYRRASKNNKLKNRIHSAMPLNAMHLLDYQIKKYGNNDN